MLMSKLFGKAQLEALRMLQSHSFTRWVSSVEWLSEKPRLIDFVFAFKSLEAASTPTVVPNKTSAIQHHSDQVTAVAFISLI